MKIAIVGGNGFIGKNLATYFTTQNFEIKSFTKDNPAFENLSELKDCSAVIWAASRVNPVTAEFEIEQKALEVAEINQFLKTMQALMLHETPLIYFSSGGCLYNGDDRLFSETDLAEGINSYGKLKKGIEQSLLASRLNFIILRIANVYGPNQPHGRGQGVIAEWLHAEKKNEALRVLGSLNSYRDYIYIDDLCTAIHKIIECAIPSGIYNLGTGTATTLSEIISKFEFNFGQNLSHVYLPSRSIDRVGYTLNSQKLKLVTDWNPKYSFEEGFNQTMILGKLDAE
jgi:UDP-glucose 4-epimerase